MALFIPARFKYRGLHRNSPTEPLSEPMQSDDQRLSSVDESSGTPNHATPQPQTSEADEMLDPKRTDSKRSSRLTGWRPLSLRRTTIAAYVALFCSMLAGLEVMKQYSDSHQGLASTSQRWHYFWTYGPTAIFTLLAAFWQRTEYRATQLAPWVQMSRGRTAASRSLLLDYVSGFQPHVIGASLKNAHYSVAAAVTGSLAISIMIIASTGLLGLEQRSITVDKHPLLVSTTFGGSRSDLDNAGTLPLYVAQALRALQLPYPTGTTSRYTIQSFESTSDISTGSQLTASVDGLLSEVNCETAEIKIDYWYYMPAQLVEFGSVPPIPVSSTRVTSPTCQFSHSFPYQTYGVDYIDQVIDVTCEGGSDSGSRRLFVLYATTSMSESQNISLTQSAQLVCEPSYTFSKVSATVNTSQDATQSIVAISPRPNSNQRVLSDISAWNIAEAYLLVFKNAQLDLGPLDPYDDQQDIAFYFTTLQYPNSQAADFLNTSHLKTAFESFYSLLTTQIVKQLLVQPSKDSITGTLNTSENRLVVRNLSLRLLEGFLGLAAALGIIMIFFLPASAIMPQDPGRLLGLAIVLSRSRHTMRTLQDTGALAIKTIKTRIFGIEYYTSSGSTNDQAYFQVGAKVPVFYKMEAMPSTPTVTKWWRPFMAGRWALASCIAIQVGIVVALEITLRKSQKYNGLGDVSTDGYLQYTWSLIPAFVLSCIALAYSSIGFHAKVFAPYGALQSSTASSNALLVNYLDKIEIHCLWNAVRRRQFAVVGISSAIILGSLLPIAISGVFLVQAVPAQVSVDVSIASWFNTSNIGGSVIVNNTFAGTQGPSALNAMVASALVIWGNLSYPAWTFGEFVFPHLKVTPLPLADASYAMLHNATSLQVKIPALRSKSECGWYKTDKELNATFSPITTCNYDANTTSCTSSIDYTNIIYKSSDDPYCPGNAPFEVPVSVGIFGSVSNVYAGCPPTYSWGKTGVHTILHAASISCNNTMEQVEVNVTVTLPDFNIDPSNPPIADESTATFFSMPDVMDKGALFGGLPNFTSPNNYVDTYFSALVHGKDGFPLSKLADPSFDDTVAARIKHLTALIRAQEYNAQGRIPATGAIAARKLTGTATDPSRTRLVQTAVSTRIVQCLLGVMVALAVAAHFAMDTRTLLPKNPCSIAGAASLLVDSELLRDEVLLDAVRFQSDREIRKSGILERRRFRLGWFDISSSRQPVEARAATLINVESPEGVAVQHTIPRKPLPSIVTRRFGVDVVRDEEKIEEAVGLTSNDHE